MTENLNPQKNKLPPVDLPGKPFYRKIEAGCDFFKLFKVIEKETDYCFLLESLGEHSSESRYSVIGFDPTAIIQGQEGVLRYESKTDSKTIEISTENPYRELQKWMPQNVISRNYAGGLVGYLGYDAVNFFEPTLKLKWHNEFEPMLFGVYVDGLIYDKMTGEISYFYFKQDRLDRIMRWINASNQLADGGDAGDLRVTSFGFSRTFDQYRSMVEQTLEEIRAGNSFQCQIGFQEDYEFAGNTMSAYERLRQVSPSPYMFYMKLNKKVQIGASPELILQIRQGEMETYPLAGTTIRGATEEEDRVLARALLNDPKEIAEHNMLVDLHRNDLGRIAMPGTVKVRRLMDARKFSHVQHISSEVVGILNSNSTNFDALAATFPAGTLSGAPKVESMKIIERIEQSPRGPYGGAVGHFGWNGNCTFAIPIRTLFLNENRAFARASAGIVYDSTAEYEFREIERKLAAMRRTLQVFGAST